MSRARRVSALDLLVMSRLARVDSPVLDLVMPRLSQLSDYGGLWIAVAAGLWLTGGREARRAAWRGLGSYKGRPVAEGGPGGWTSTLVSPERSARRRSCLAYGSTRSPQTRRGPG
jgi:undecaprenyl-diphosphatase